MNANEKKLVYSCPGTEIAERQVLYVDDDGYQRKKIDSTYNIRVLIDSAAAGNTLARVKAAVMAVSPNGANVNPALLDGIDLSLYPQSMAEMFDRMISYEQRFNSLDEFTRSLFTDKNDFINSIIDGSIKSRIEQGIKNKVDEVVPTEKGDNQ